MENQVIKFNQVWLRNSQRKARDKEREIILKGFTLAPFDWSLCEVRYVKSFCLHIDITIHETRCTSFTWLICVSCTVELATLNVKDDIKFYVYNALPFSNEIDWLFYDSDKLFKFNVSKKAIQMFNWIKYLLVKYRKQFYYFNWVMAKNILFTIIFSRLSWTLNEIYGFILW